jgi:hypothetical protein
LPARITITSADGKIRQELLNSRDIATEAVPAQWLSPGSASMIGRELDVQIGAGDKAEADVPPNYKTVELPPGEYQVRATYNYWIAPLRWADILPVSARPTNVDPNAAQPYKGWSAQQMDRVWFQSEPTRLVVIDAGGEPPRAIGGDAPQAGSRGLDVTLRADTNRLKFGQNVDVEVSLVNRAQGDIEVFNALLSPSLGKFSRGTVMALLDVSGEPVDDVLYQSVGSSYAPTSANWATIPPGGIASTTIKFWARGNKRSPGEYALELRIHENVLTGRPWDLWQVERDRLIAQGQIDTQNANPGRQPTPDVEARGQRISYDAWERTFPGPEVIRSKRLPLEILPRTGD